MDAPRATRLIVPARLTLPRLQPEDTVIAATLLQFKSRVKSPSDAPRLYRAARYADCLHELEGSADHASVVLATRCLLRLGELRPAQATIEAHCRTNGDATDTQRGEAAMIRGIVLAKLGEATLALAAFSDARAYLYSAQHDALTVELDLQQAAAALSDFDVEAAADLAGGVIASRYPEFRISAREVVGFIRAAGDDFGAQMDLLRTSVASLAEFDHDVWQEAGTLANASIAARELDALDLFATLKTRAEALAWTEATKTLEHQTFRALGWMAALTGDHLLAFRLLRRSAEAAPSIVRTLSSTLDLAFIAREINETFSAADRLAQAREYAEAIDWNATILADRIALLALAECTASVDPGAAARLFRMYQGLGKPVASSVGAAADRRLRALECYTAGVIAGAEDQPGIAAARLSEAFEYWKSVGYVWRASECALRLLALTNETKYFDFAAAYAKRLPNGWLDRRVTRALLERATASGVPCGAPE